MVSPVTGARLQCCGIVYGCNGKKVDAREACYQDTALAGVDARRHQCSNRIHAASNGIHAATESMQQATESMQQRNSCSMQQNSCSKQQVCAPTALVEQNVSPDNRAPCAFGLGLGLGVRVGIDNGAPCASLSWAIELKWNPAAVSSGSAATGSPASNASSCDVIRDRVSHHPTPSAVGETVV